jgi:hypothetical protein
MGLRFEEINPPKKEEKPATAKKTSTKSTKSSKVEKSTDS